MDEQGFKPVDILEIARAAGDAIMKVYTDSEHLGIRRKADDTPVTQADLAANQIIVDGLKNLSLEYPVLSEENQIPEYEERQHWDRFWMVDPLDGTKEFINRNGEFTVNIALIEGDSPVFGCIFVPVTRRMVWAVKGMGAVEWHSKDPVSLTVAGKPDGHSPIRVVGSRSHLDDRTQSFIDGLGGTRLLRVGSSIKFLHLAEGSADVYPRFGPTMEWDIAAAQIILEEAGGSVLRVDSGRPLSYNKVSLRNPDFVARGWKQSSY